MLLSSLYLFIQKGFEKSFFISIIRSNKPAYIAHKLIGVFVYLNVWMYEFALIKLDAVSLLAVHWKAVRSNAWWILWFRILSQPMAKCVYCEEV